MASFGPEPDWAWLSADTARQPFLSFRMRVKSTLRFGFSTHSYIEDIGWLRISMNCAWTQNSKGLEAVRTAMW